MVLSLSIACLYSSPFRESMFVYKGVPYDTSGGLCPEGLQEEARRPVSYDLYAVVLLNLPNEWSTLHPDWILIFPIIIHKSTT